MTSSRPHGHRRRHPDDQPVLVRKKRNSKHDVPCGPDCGVYPRGKNDLALGGCLGGLLRALGFDTQTRPRHTTYWVERYGERQPPRHYFCPRPNMFVENIPMNPSGAGGSQHAGGSRIDSPRGGGSRDGGPEAASSQAAGDHRSRQIQLWADQIGQAANSQQGQGSRAGTNRSSVRAPRRASGLGSRRASVDGRVESLGTRRS